VKTYLQS